MGVAPVVISFIFCTYYNVVIGWALYYLFSSFSSQLPWATCDHDEWNTTGCDDSRANRTLAGVANFTTGLAAGGEGLMGNRSAVLGNGSVFEAVLKTKTATLATTPEEEYFR